MIAAFLLELTYLKQQALLWDYSQHSIAFFFLISLKTSLFWVPCTHVTDLLLKDIETGVLLMK